MSTAVKDRVGPIALRPVIPPDGIGASYHATDEGTDYEWNGVDWVPMSSAEISSDEIDGDSSYQAFAGDTNLADTAGSDDDTSFFGGVMGNLLGGVLSKTKNYLGGLIGHISITSSASTYPTGAVLAGIGDGVDDPSVHGVIAYIDGDSAETVGGAAFKVMNNNSTPGSGFHFGVDLQSAAHDGFDPVDSAFYLSAPVRLVEDVVVLVGAGAPVDGTTGDNLAGPGSLYVDITGADLYVQSAVKTAPVWKLVTRAA